MEGSEGWIQIFFQKEAEPWSLGDGNPQWIQRQSARKVYEVYVLQSPQKLKQNVILVYNF